MNRWMYIHILDMMPGDIVMTYVFNDVCRQQMTPVPFGMIVSIDTTTDTLERTRRRMCVLTMNGTLVCEKLFTGGTYAVIKADDDR